MAQDDVGSTPLGLPLFRSTPFFSGKIGENGAIIFCNGLFTMKDRKKKQKTSRTSCSSW